MSAVMCPNCPHPRSEHDSDGCWEERQFEGWTFVCSCGVPRYCITDAGTYHDPNGEPWDPPNWGEATL